MGGINPPEGAQPLLKGQFGFYGHVAVEQGIELLFVSDVESRPSEDGGYHLVMGLRSGPSGNEAAADTFGRDGVLIVGVANRGGTPDSPGSIITEDRSGGVIDG